MEYKITPCRITSEIINTLAAIAESIGQLEGVNLTIPSRQIRRKNRIQTIHSSLAIEGNSLTNSQVTALMDDKRVIGPQHEILEVQNAIATYGRLADFNYISMDSLLHAHAVMMNGLMRDPGILRREPIGVIREKNIFHEAPHWKEVEFMMQALFDYLKESDDHTFLKSSRFHFQLEHIHPFTDGNGRIGRLWQTRILMTYHPIFEFLPIEHLIREHQQIYYRTLANGDDTNDCNIFVAFILKQIKDSLRELIADTRGLTMTADNRLDIAQSTFGTEPFSRKDYQNLHKTISTATASRDLQLGVQKGLLRRSGDKRTSIYRFESMP